MSLNYYRQRKRKCIEKKEKIESKRNLKKPPAIRLIDLEMGVLIHVAKNDLGVRTLYENFIGETLLDISQLYVSFVEHILEHVLHTSFQNSSVVWNFNPICFQNNLRLLFEHPHTSGMQFGINGQHFFNGEDDNPKVYHVPFVLAVDFRRRTGNNSLRGDA